MSPILKMDVSYLDGRCYGQQMSINVWRLEMIARQLEPDYSIHGGPDVCACLHIDT